MVKVDAQCLLHNKVIIVTIALHRHCAPVVPSSLLHLSITPSEGPIADTCRAQCHFRARILNAPPSDTWGV